MKTLTIERTVNAPRSAVWAVLADYPNIADWNDGVNTSFAIGDATEGVGAIRKCELDGNVAMRETVTAWNEGQTMAIAIDQIEKMPVKQASMTFTLGGADADQSTVQMRYEYEPKGGAFGFLIAAMMSKPMKTGFNGFIDNLETAAQARD